jgi:hypothetical protein
MRDDRTAGDRYIALALGIIAVACWRAGAARGDGPRRGEMVQTPTWTFCCSEDNDLYRVLRESGVDCGRFADPKAAVAAAAPGSGVLILADGYPEARTPVPVEVLDAARERAVRLYVEYPGGVPGLTLGAPKVVQWERAVVRTGFFGSELPPMSILVPHGCRYLEAPVDGGTAHLVAARVAGYRRAEFGLPEETHPLLLEMPGSHVLVGTTCLSHFVRGRYGPARDWAALWSAILGWLAGRREGPRLTWTPTVRPAFAGDAPLPPSAERDAFDRGVDWYYRSGLLLSRERVELLAPSFSRGVEDGPSPARDLPIGDGTLGLLEGYSSRVGADGTQPQRYVVRNDCLGESAMAFACDSVLRMNRRSGQVARNLANFICHDSLIQQGIRADPTHPTFGLMAWGTTSWAWERAFYGDDNARSLLGLLATAALLDSDEWDESALRALLANLRTTGPLGFRGDRIDVPDLEQLGWRHFAERPVENPAPHYEGYLWACFLWAYRATGEREFLDKAEAGISRTMAVYPTGWGMTNGMVLLRSRMLLPLAWLVRVDDTPLHRQWLFRVAADLLRHQDACGALREEVGDSDRGSAPSALSNAAYGTGETLVIQRNGDPATDLLYCSNFAVLGLHEAAAATGDARLREAEDALARFLCRAQARSEAHPELDGAWFRAFDFDLWEYWGSSGDVGWGAWSIETGWTQAWIVAVLGLRTMDTDLWDLTANSRIGERLGGVKALMARNDGRPFVPTPQPIATLATGALYVLARPADARYPGRGDRPLTDGLAWPIADHTGWCGWLGADLEVTVDLGSERALAAAGARFLTCSDLGIYAPLQLEVSMSLDGATFGPAVSVDLALPIPGDRLRAAREVLVPVPGRARYVRVVARSIGTIPAWHWASGREAWLFADEVIVR